MRNAPIRRRSSFFALASFLSLFLLLVGGGVFATMYALGIQMPWMAAAQPPRIRIPVNARPIAAYASVSREDLIDMQKQSLAFIDLRPEQVQGMSLATLGSDGAEVVSFVKEVQIQGSEITFVSRDGTIVPASLVYKLGGAYMQPSDVIGRVLSREKKPGYGFTEESFLPKGTRPGIAGGVPAGKHAITIEADKISGVHAVRPGDHVDLIASIPQEHLARFTPGDNSHLPGAALVVKPVAAGKAPPGEARLIADDAVLVTPVTTRASTITSSSLTQGKQVKAVPVQEVVVAVNAADVPLLTEILANGFPITCVVRSGRPDEAAKSAVPEGMVAVPLSARPIAAFTTLLKDDLTDPKTRKPKFIYVDEADAAIRGFFTSELDLAGRVTAQDLPTGHVFTESDFLPVGTPAGLAGGIPAGKRAFVVDEEKVRGVAALSRGQRFDLVASRPVELPKSGGSGSRLLTAAGAPANLQRHATTQVVVDDGVVVVPAPQATTDKERKSSEVILAISPEEVSTLSEMLALDVELTAVARSSQRGDSGAALIVKDNHPLANARTLEAMVGTRRETMVFVPGGATLSQAVVAGNVSAEERRDPQVAPVAKLVEMQP